MSPGNRAVQMLIDRALLRMDEEAPQIDPPVDEVASYRQIPHVVALPKPAPKRSVLRELWAKILGE